MLLSNASKADSCEQRVYGCKCALSNQELNEGGGMEAQSFSRAKCSAGRAAVSLLTDAAAHTPVLSGVVRDREDRPLGNE
jgi:hypothetical protein